MCGQAASAEYAPPLQVLALKPFFTDLAQVPFYDDLGNPGRYLLTHRQTLPASPASGSLGALVLEQSTPRWALPSNDGVGIVALAQMLQSVQARATAYQTDDTRLLPTFSRDSNSGGSLHRSESLCRASIARFRH